jgi:endonuclease-3
MRPRASPLLALVVVTAIWGYTFVPVQEAVAAYPLFAFLAVRFAISSAALAPFAWRPLRALPRRGWAAGLGAGTLLAAAYGLQTAGLELTTVTSTGFITGLYVVFTPLIALAAWRTPVPAPVWVGVVLALAGLLLLSGAPGGSWVGRRRERIGPIVERLAEEHADAQIALRFRSDLELLVSVMLSAQTTDTNVNRVTERLFEKYRKPEDYLGVPQEELERDIYATGFFRQKAKAIRGTMHVLLEEFDGRVPGRLEDLVRLPGVARKTANVVASELGHAQGVVVDTHVRRLSQRLGLTRQEDPVKIERDLQRVVPRADWARFPHLLIWHGRRVCDARRPLCEECVIEDLCPASRLAWAELRSSVASGTARAARSSRPR